MLTVTLIWAGGRVSSRRRGWADEAIRRAIRGAFGRRARWEERAAYHFQDGGSVYWGTVGGHRLTVEVSP